MKQTRLNHVRVSRPSVESHMSVQKCLDIWLLFLVVMRYCFSYSLPSRQWCSWKIMRRVTLGIYEILKLNLPFLTISNKNWKISRSVAVQNQIRWPIRTFIKRAHIKFDDLGFSCMPIMDNSSIFILWYSITSFNFVPKVRDVVTLLVLADGAFFWNFFVSCLALSSQ